MALRPRYQYTAQADRQDEVSTILRAPVQFLRALGNITKSFLSCQKFYVTILMHSLPDYIFFDKAQVLRRRDDVALALSR